MELVFLNIAILFLLTIALNTSFDVQAKVPDLDRNKVAKIINELNLSYTKIMKQVQID